MTLTPTLTEPGLRVEISDEEILADLLYPDPPFHPGADAKAR